jgi:hypothetical protein
MVLDKLNVEWIPCGGFSGNWGQNMLSKNLANIMWYEPQPFLKHIIEERNKDVLYLKCPAFTDLYKNTYVIKCPIDLVLSYGKDENGFPKLICESHDQQFCDKFIIQRQVTENNKFNMISLSFGYLMFSDSSLEAEVCYPSMSHHKSDTLKNISVISGKYDIGKWVRPLEFSFEVHDISKPIIFKRGDPLYYVRFHTDKKIKLVRSEVTTDLMDIVESCALVKLYKKRNTLQENYSMAEHLIRKFRSKFKKCPFGFKK